MKCNTYFFNILARLGSFLFLLAILQSVSSQPRGVQEDIIIKNNEAQPETHTLPTVEAIGITQPTSPQNKTNICFPYFISLDIDGLLARATRMLNSTLDNRHKSWLQVFITRLDSLSKQLKNLPLENKNLCFLKRQKFLSESKIRKNPNGMSPRVDFAKQIFETQGKTRKAPYIAEKPDDYSNLGQLKPYQPVLLSRPIRDSPMKGTFTSSSEIIFQMQNKTLNSGIPRRKIYVTVVQPSLTNRTDAREMMPETTLTLRKISGASNEHLPFLARSTRKTIPWQILERLKYKTKMNKSEIVPELSPVPDQNKVDGQEEESRNQNASATPTDQGRLTSLYDSTARNDFHAELSKHDINHQYADKTLENSQPNPTVPMSNSYDDVVVQLHDRGKDTNHQVAITNLPHVQTPAVNFREFLPFGTSKPADAEDMKVAQGMFQEEEQLRPESGNAWNHEYIYGISDLTPHQRNYGNNPDVGQKDENDRPRFIDLLHTRKETDPQTQTTQDNEEEDAVLQLKDLKFSSTSEKPYPLPIGSTSTEQVMYHMARPKGRIH